jgi:hypothetical protein
MTLNYALIDFQTMSLNGVFDVWYSSMLSMTMINSVERDITGKAIGPKLSDMRAKGRLFWQHITKCIHCQQVKALCSDSDIIVNASRYYGSVKHCSEFSLKLERIISV